MSDVLQRTGGKVVVNGVIRPRIAALGAGLLLVVLLPAAGCGGSGPSQEANIQQAPEAEVSTGDAHTGERVGPAGYDAATRDDEEFNGTFKHEFAEVNGVKMHYVIGGEGPPLVLLHGWPQTWYEWIEVMPALGEEHTVVAVDLPGLGDSEGEPPSYDKATLARYVHGLVSEELGYNTVNLAAHDLGAGVGYQYAAQNPDEVEGFVLMDYALPGPAIDAAQFEDFSWHIALHREERLPEMLTEGREREYLAYFYPEVAASPESIPAEAIDEYARTYSQPGKMSAGFELYRTLDEDTEDNIEDAETPLEMLVLVMTGTTGAGYEGADVEGFTTGTVRPVASDVSSVGVPDAGHYLAEENPEFVANELLRFFE